MESLNLDPGYLNTLFKFDEVKNTINFIGNDISVNTQQLYNWYKKWNSSEEGIIHETKIYPSGFNGHQPAIIFIKGLMLNTPNVPVFYVHGMILAEKPGLCPFFTIGGTRIIQSKYTRPNAYLFVSHSSIDKPFIRKLVSKINKICDTFFDERDIRPGDRIAERIGAELDRATTLLLVLSNSSAKSHWVAKEWGGYLHSEKRVLVVKIDEVEVPALLRDIKYINGNQDIDVVVNEIQNGLE
jgi:TIR domain